MVKEVIGRMIFAGVVFYNYTKLQNMAAKQREKDAQKAAGDVEKTPLVPPAQPPPSKQ